MKEIERSKSGNPILRHDHATKNREVNMGNPQHLEKLENHVEKYLGKITSVLHEMVSEIIHLDILYLEPTDERPFHTFVTSGMSNLPMTVSIPEYQYAELIIALPQNWKVSQEAFKENRYYWPIELIKRIARLPHEFNTWIGTGHTIPNGDPEVPYADNTRFTGVVVLPPVGIDQSFWTLPINENKLINFYTLIPLYKEEMNLKLNKGLDPLLDKLDQYNVTFLVNINRKNMCKKPIFDFYNNK